MKLNKKTGNISHSGNLKKEKFKIAASAHAFEILSSRLYTDTKLAIVRELSTNAADSHIEAGNAKQPFDVHLPTLREPYLKIRDFGTGLSHDDVMQVYRTYFDSTRNNSDEFTGALGLGSKSPFAYTDAFMVTSYLNGEVRSYSIFRDEMGEPSVTHMGTASTNEPNGLEIHIDVNTKDCHEFQDRAQKVYEYFNIKPNFIGQQVTFPTRDIILNGDNWRITHTRRGFGGGNINIVMGNIRYNVSGSQFSHRLTQSGDLTVWVPIGTCSVAANREELHYDDKTKHNIQFVLDATFKEAEKQVDDLLADADSTLDKIRKGKLYRKVVTLKGLPNSLPTNVKDKYSSHKLRVTHNKMSMRREDYTELYPEPGTKYIFIKNDVGDIKQKHRNAMRHWINQQQGGYSYLFTIEDEDVFKKAFGEPTINLSDIPSAPRQSGVAGGPRCSIKKLRSHYRKTDCWSNAKAEDIDTDTSLAVRRKGYNVIINGKTCDDPSVALEIAYGLGFKHVYGLSAQRFDKARRELGLQDLDTVAKKATDKFVKSGSTIQHAVIKYGKSNYIYSFHEKLRKCIKNEGQICVNALAFMTDQTPDIYLRLLNLFGGQVRDVENPVEIFWNKYPLLRGLDKREVSETEIKEYVRWKNQNS